jgi:predicted Zn-dependent protease
MEPSSRLMLTISRVVLPGAALLLLPVLSYSQTNSTNATPASAQSNPVAHTISDDPAAGSQLTAAEQQPAETPAVPSSNAVIGTSGSVAAGASTLPTVATPPANEPDKYNVNLIGHRNVGTGLNFYSLEREIAVGQDLSKQVEATSKLVTDPEISSYVNRIGQNLVRNSDSRVPFTIKVIDSNEINAFALPGGFFYVDSGLILAAESEAELAAIMAHEIAHVAARHATKNMTKQQIWNMASIPLMFVGGPAGYAIAEVASLAVPMSFLKFSRDSEREADMLGLQYDYAAGYDPQAFIQFFERLKAQEKAGKHTKIAKMFSTHPMTADRISAAQSEIQTYFPSRDSYIVDTSEFDSMKSRLLVLQGNHRLTVDQGGNRPVLRKHTENTAPATAQPAPQSSTPNSTDTGDDRPTLKRTNSNPD